MEELLLKAVGNVGVPAVLCFYVLFALNKSVNDLKEAIKDFGKEHKSQLDRIESIIRTAELRK